MTGIPRMPRDNDPRKPRKQPDDARELSGNPPRSYGQSADMSDREIDELEEFEDVTDEVAREGGDDTPGSTPGSGQAKDRKLREFEDLAGEPVMDDEKKSG